MSLMEEPIISKKELTTEEVMSYPEDNIKRIVDYSQQCSQLLSADSKFNYAFIVRIVFNMFVILSITLLFIFLKLSHHETESLNNYIVQYNTKVVDEINFKTKEIKELSQSIQDSRNEYITFRVDNELLLTSIKESQIYIPVSEEYKFNFDFNNNKIMTIELIKKDGVDDTKSVNKLSAEKVKKLDVQLIWCSQYVTGYIALGKKKKIIRKEVNYERQFLTKFGNGASKNVRMFTVWKNKACKFFNDSIEMDEGKIYVQSEGKGKDLITYKDRMLMQSDRQTTDIILIIKGLYVQSSSE